MPAYLTCKCPQCDKITSYSKWDNLEKDRTEYDSIRCSKCRRTTKSNGLKAPTLRKKVIDSVAIGTGNGYYPGMKKKALMTNRFGPGSA